MSLTVLEIRGEVFVTLASAAACYEVELAWVEEISAAGVLGPCERVDGRPAVRARELDRLALLLRWTRHHELDLETALALL